VSKSIITKTHASHLQAIVRLYKPHMGQSWRQRTPDQLWLRVLSQIVVAGNATPGDTLRNSQAVRERLGYSRLKKLPSRLRRQQIHRVLQAIGTRYVGKKARNRKVNAAVHNFKALIDAGGPRRFFEKVAAQKGTAARANNLSKRLDYYKKKGCRDILIELRLASDCIALDQRIKKILEGVGVKIHGSINRQYQQIEQELIGKVGELSGLTGGQLDRILFQNYGDIMVRLLCPSALNGRSPHLSTAPIISPRTGYLKGSCCILKKKFVRAILQLVLTVRSC
jgi:hypothetical protein